MPCVRRARRPGKKKVDPATRLVTLQFRRTVSVRLQGESDRVMTMSNFFAVGIGAFLGAILRWLLGIALNPVFPRCRSARSRRILSAAC